MSRGRRNGVRANPQHHACLKMWTYITLCTTHTLYCSSENVSRKYLIRATACSRTDVRNERCTNTSTGYCAKPFTNQLSNFRFPNKLLLRRLCLKVMGQKLQWRAWQTQSFVVGHKYTRTGGGQNMKRPNWFRRAWKLSIHWKPPSHGYRAALQHIIAQVRFSIPFTPRIIILRVPKAVLYSNFDKNVIALWRQMQALGCRPKTDIVFILTYNHVWLCSHCCSCSRTTPNKCTTPLTYITN